MSINCKKQMADNKKLNYNVEQQAQVSADTQLPKLAPTPPPKLFPHELFKNRN